MTWALVLLWLGTVLLAFVLGWLLRGDVQVSAKDDGDRYVKVRWDLP